MEFPIDLPPRGRSKRPSLRQKQANSGVDQVLNNGEYPSICGEALIGMGVSKRFGRKMYNGVVRSFDPLVAWYGIKYEDSDEEEVDFAELQNILLNPGVLTQNLHGSPSKNHGATRKRRKDSSERTVESPKLTENLEPKLKKERASPSVMDFKGVQLVQGNELVVQGGGNLMACTSIGEASVLGMDASDGHTKSSKSSGGKNNEGTPCEEGEKDVAMGHSDGVGSLCQALVPIEGARVCEKVVERSYQMTYKALYRRERMNPLEWPDIRPVPGGVSSESCPIDRVKEVWNLSDECVSLLQDLAGQIYVDESLLEAEVDKVKECQRAFYTEWVKHDEIEREKIEIRGRSPGMYGRTTINNAIRIAERAMERKKINTGVNIGHVPGVPVNLEVQVRAELNCMGLHCPKSRAACVDFVEYKPRTGEPVPLALSVVVSRCKNVRPDEVDEMVFLGDGGEHAMKGEGGPTRIRKHKTDQGLVNCHRFGLPIRMIRQVSARGCVLKYRYIYEGLWWVSEAWSEMRGSMKFRLVRMSKGGPGERKVLLRPHERVVCEDISFGQESVKIPAVNGVDDAIPPGLDGPWSQSQTKSDYSFQYTTEYVYSDPSVHCPAVPKIEHHEDPHTVIERLNMCAPYILQKGSKIPLLNRRRSILYECGPWCQCVHGNDCFYAVTDRGMPFKLQVFRTQHKGWGVRTLEYIPAGAYVTTYAGLVIPHGHPEVDKGRSEYVFDMCRRTDMSNDNEYLDMHRTDIEIKYAVDAKHRGNVARFINHSCDPNVFVQPTLSTHLDESMPKICLFASKHIFPGEELNYDYGTQFVMDCLNGKCHCGANNCITADLSDFGGGVESHGMGGGDLDLDESKDFNRNRMENFEGNSADDFEEKPQVKTEPNIGPEMANYINGWTNGQFSHACDLKVRVGAVQVLDGTDEGSSEYSDVNIA